MGYIKVFQDKLLNDSNSKAWLEQMHKAHKSYSSYRWELLSEEDKKTVEANGW